MEMGMKTNSKWYYGVQVELVLRSKLVVRFRFPNLSLIAAENNLWTFVEELLKLMPPETLELKDTKYGNTALHIAAREGNKKVAEAIVNKNREVTQIRDKDEKIPLLTAALFVSPGQKETLEYLCEVTSDVDPNPFAGPDGATVMCSILDAHFYDIALVLFQRYPNLVMEKTKYSKVWPLEVIVERPYAFQSGTNARSIPVIQVDMTTPLGSLKATGDAENPSECLQNFSFSGNRGINAKFFCYFITRFTQFPAIKRIYRLKVMHKQAADLVKGMIDQVRMMTTKTEASDFFRNSSIMEKGIKFGTNEVVEECLLTFPDLNWTQMNNKRLIQIAIEERNGKILKLICKTSEDYQDQLVSHRDRCGNSILHYAAKLADPPQLNLVSGAALQMQREMQWFKGVLNLLPENGRMVRNKEVNTAQSMFTKEHDKLRWEGEKWMKETSQSCMVVAALIATVVFAAAFTVPGGNVSEDKSGKKASTPILLYENSFVKKTFSLHCQES
ncbi:uncharacterized protein LOC113329722 [Papaver somniferum]|uniref:uncharacterized protein LOC113329722 n=1 Tax=Papaver somniferum TaxID=3469 RepID=UPI000E703F48|nr:uncharacterized protein LOC113329722 [Papaver somniferum]